MTWSLTALFAATAFASPGAFADSEPGDGKLAFLMFVGSAVGAVGQFVVGKLLDLRRERGEKSARDEANVVAHQRALIERIDVEKKQLESKNRELEEERECCQREMHGEKILRAVMRRHVRYVEGILSRERVPFEPYADDGSDAHKPLSPLPPAPDATAESET